MQNLGSALVRCSVWGKKNLSINVFILHFSEIDLFGNIAKVLQLHEHQQVPFEIYEENSVDRLIRGLTVQPSQQMDSSVSKEARANID